MVMRNVRLQVEELEARNLLSVFTPAQIRHAYGFDQLSFTNGRVRADGSGQTIAIVEAFHDPKIASDLHYFDWIFGLPDPPKFTQVNERGGTAFTSVNPAWALETAMDVEWAHAIAPRANILLVEADSDSFTDLLAAVNFSRYQSGVVVVSMSWGSQEFSYETAYDAYFTTPPGHMGGSGLPGGITFVASTGDSGGGTSYPAVSPNVLAVGGTSLTIGPGGNYGSEKAWSGSGGGISLYESKPSFQMSLAGSMRSTPDVALNSDPYTGYYIYDTVPYWGISGWFQDAGTSAAAPQWAALIALADQGRALMGKGSLSNAQSVIYSLPAGDFHDITGGSSGYAAVSGYDLVTGRGTPKANLIVPHLLGLGTLSVLPVMARGGVAIPSLSATPFLAEMPLVASMSRDLANERLFGQDLDTKSPTSILPEQGFVNSSSLAFVFHQDDHDPLMPNDLINSMNGSFFKRTNLQSFPFHNQSSSSFAAKRSGYGVSYPRVECQRMRLSVSSSAASPS
jgi:subtilase family serine protease